MRRVVHFKRALGPATVVACGLLASAALLQGRPAAQTIEPEPEPPATRVLTAEPESLRLRVRSQGTAAPRTQSDLIAQVPGQMLSVEPGLEPGAFFQKGELLAQLDPHDLELAVELARATLQRARVEEEYARSTLERRLALLDGGIASAAIVDDGRRLAGVAVARRREAEIALARARRDLEQTRLVAPFDGRTLDRNVDVGSFVSVGTPLARLYAVDYAEVRLPIADAELAFLELPLGEELPPEAAPAVELRARFAGRVHSWAGHIVRTEAAIDPRTRMVHVVARVPRPYEQSRSDVRPPLAAGLFVEAEILGRRVSDVVRVPRSALAGGESLWIVDPDDRLRRRSVEVVRVERATVLVASGLVAGDRVALLEPRLARDGLVVRPLDEKALADQRPVREPTS